MLIRLLSLIHMQLYSNPFTHFTLRQEKSGWQRSFVHRRNCDADADVRQRLFTTRPIGERHHAMRKHCQGMYMTIGTIDQRFEKNAVSELVHTI